ncbi:hypothetical protein EVAR_6222_1 [Eumeta japonica]|uniref:Uncharacterized protein n=1 Tax=Eumeta variegata TaxID=151549 RepID=A0A4C1Z2V7_EUMVA|nr:hypothetical protein EVAR_6222_1 [Eumeta japonica]
MARGTAGADYGRRCDDDVRGRRYKTLSAKLQAQKQKEIAVSTADAAGAECRRGACLRARRFKSVNEVLITEPGIFWSDAKRTYDPHHNSPETSTQIEYTNVEYKKRRCLTNKFVGRTPEEPEPILCNTTFSTETKQEEETAATARGALTISGV